jgi:hypothetical protein
MTNTLSNHARPQIAEQPDLAGKVIYLSGKITGDLVFKTKFKTWAIRILSRGARKVLNPASLPDGWEYDEYMEHCMIMVRRCDIVAVMPDWEDSKGARSEVAYALALGKPIKKLVLYEPAPKPPTDE